MSDDRYRSDPNAYRGRVIVVNLLASLLLAVTVGVLVCWVGGGPDWAGIGFSSLAYLLLANEGRADRVRRAKRERDS